jgi:uncharacterized protein involved in exopolysaccharide biosynthesis
VRDDAPDLGAARRASRDVGKSNVTLWGVLRPLFPVFLGAVIGGVVALALAFLLTPDYRSTITVMPIEHEPEAGAVGELVGRFSGLARLAGAQTDSTERNRALAVLRSRSLALQLIEEEKLLPTLFPNRWDGAEGKWRPGRTPTSNDAYEKFDEKIRTVSEDRRTGLVRLSITWRDPGLASKWANRLIERANERLRSRAIADSEQSIAYLNKELANVSLVDIRQGMYRLMEAEINSIMLAKVHTDYAFQIIDPAVPSDRDDEVWPNKLLFVLSGLILGAVAGASLLLVSGRRP